MFRFIFVAIFLILYLILSIPVFFVEWLIGKFNPHARDISSLRIVQWGFKVILKMTGVKVTVIGEENVPDEPVLFIGNHRSFFDILLTYSRCRNLTGYVAKKEMEKVPLLSTWMRFVYCLFLDRENPKEGLKTILRAIDYVKKGISICIFPEGTRSRSSEMGEFKHGSFKLATKAKVPIVPVTLNGGYHTFEDHGAVTRGQHIDVLVHPPIETKDMSRQELAELPAQVEAIIRAGLAELVQQSGQEEK